MNWVSFSDGWPPVDINPINGKPWSADMSVEVMVYPTYMIGRVFDICESDPDAVLPRFFQTQGQGACLVSLSEFTHWMIPSPPKESK